MTTESTTSLPSRPLPPGLSGEKDRTEAFPSKGHVRRVLILNGDVAGNLGDRAILQATCAALAAVDPKLEIQLSASLSADQLELVAKTIPRGVRGLASLCLAAVRSDLILCGGGGLFQDDDSLIKMPYWCLRTLLVRLFCRRVVGYSLGVGPLRARTSRLAARAAFAAMERVTVRDPAAQATAQTLTRKPVAIVPDPALLLDPAPPERVERWLLQRGVRLGERPVIGVAARRWFPPRRRIIPHALRCKFQPSAVELTEGSKRLASRIALALDRTIESRDVDVLLLPSYHAPHEGDEEVCREVQDRMQHRGRARLLRVDNPSLYKGIVARLDLLVGGRMHPTIFAAAAGVPVVGLAYNPKFHGFFRLIDASEQVMDVEDLFQDNQLDALVDRIIHSLTSPGVASSRIQALQNEVREFLAGLLSPVACPEKRR